MPTATTPIAVGIADFNDDGKPDLAVATWSNAVSVLLNMTEPGSSTPSFTAKVDFAIGRSSNSFAIGDLNGDGKPDLAVPNDQAGTASVLLNTTATGATTPTFAPKVDFTTATAPRSLAMGDFNGDSKLDLSVANYSSSSVSVLFNTTPTGATTPTFATKVDFATGMSPSFVAAGDLNGDGKQDVVVANLLGNTISVLINTTTTGATSPSFAAKSDFPAAGNPWSIAIGDLNGDTKVDLAVANFAVSILLNTAATGATTPSFAAKVDVPGMSSNSSVAIGDLNRSGKPDLVVTNASSDTVSVLVNTTDTGATAPSFATAVDFATGSNPRSVAVGDLNGDGKLDVAVANADTNTVSVLLSK